MYALYQLSEKEGIGYRESNPGLELSKEEGENERSATTKRKARRISSIT